MGKSWITTVLGYITLVSTWLEQVFVEQAIPQTGKEWLMFIALNAGGLIGIFAKDFNKSNAPAPVETRPVQ